MIVLDIVTFAIILFLYHRDVTLKLFVKPSKS
jgi:hypothetical protein